MTRSLLSITDLTAQEIQAIIDNAIKLKAEIKQNGIHAELPLKNRSMAMIFDKASLRTRLSFEVGMTQLGGHAVYLAPDDIKIGVRESVHDSAVVISSMADIIIARVSRQADVAELAANSRVPVVNAMTDDEHPCQALADLLTIYEEFGNFDGLKIAYVGDAANVTASLALAAETLGIEMCIAAPKEYELSSPVRKKVPSVRYFNDPAEAVKGADVVITDTWVSMGKEAEAAERLKILAPYQVTKELMAQADPKAIFLHCLPAYRGKEVTAEVIDGPQSRVFQEAENRLHAQKALVLHLLH